MRILAISADDRGGARDVADTHRLSYPVLADPTLTVIDRYGVRHAGKNIALPAVFVVTPARKVAYAHVARRLWDRPDRRALEAVIRGLRPR